MQRRGSTLVFKLSLIGAVMILVNGLWIIVNNRPVILSTDPTVSSVDALGSMGQFWGRISFGIAGLVEGLWAPFWLFFDILLFAVTIQIHRKPTKHRSLWPPMLAFSVLTIPIGGGFFIGFVLAVIAALLAAEWPKPFGETFLGRIAGAAKWNAKAITELANDEGLVMKALGTLLLASFIGGLGSIVYVFNVNMIKTKPSVASEILFSGQLSTDLTMIISAVSSAGIAFLRWIMLSSLLYLVMVKMKRVNADFTRVAFPIAFAFLPLSLQAVLPILFSNEPYLSLDWPLAIILLSVLLVVLALVATISSLFEIRRKEALGIVVLAGALYWFVDTLLITTNPFVDIPGVRLSIDPISSGSVTLFASIAILVSISLGALNRQREI